MKTKNKILLILGILLLFIFLYQANSTYAKYVHANSPSLDGEYEKWSIKVNNKDLESTKLFDTSTLTIFIDKNNEENKFFSDDILAPGRYGYIDIEIDYSNVTVPFSYEISTWNDSNNKNIIEYIRPIDHEETDDEIIQYMSSYKSSLLDINNPTKGTIRIPSNNEDTNVEGGTTPTSSGTDTSNKILKFRVYVIWKKNENGTGNSYTDNSISGGKKVTYHVLLNFKQLLDTDPDIPSSSDPVDYLEIKDRTSIKDSDGDKRISFGDIITLESERFYVVNTANEDLGHPVVEMISEYNLNVGENKAVGADGLQNAQCLGSPHPFENVESEAKCTVAFSDGLDDNQIKEKYGFNIFEHLPIFGGTRYISFWADKDKYPYYVAEEAEIFVHVKNYVDVLKGYGYNSIQGSLMTYDDINKLCNRTESFNCNFPTWIKNTSFWSGDASNRATLWYVDRTDKFSNNIPFYEKNLLGVRPYIIMLAEELK